MHFLAVIAVTSLVQASLVGLASVTRFPWIFSCLCPEALIPYIGFYGKSKAVWGLQKLKWFSVPLCGIPGYPSYNTSCARRPQKGAMPWILSPTYDSDTYIYIYRICILDLYEYHNIASLTILGDSLKGECSVQSKLRELTSSWI